MQFIVGDDFQSIYSWRGANFRNIITFPHRYAGTQIFNTTNSSGQGEIFCGVIGGASGPDSSHLGHVRQKLGRDDLIVTVRGAGYRFEEVKATTTPRPKGRG